MRLNGIHLFAIAIIFMAGPACEETEPTGPDAGGDNNAFTAIYNSDYFQECAGCHAPGAPGFVEGTEATQDWSTRNTAYSSLQGMASGLIGNFAGCNGVPFIGADSGSSLLVAVFDENVRNAFDLTAHPDCDMNAIADETLKLGGPMPATLLADLKAWIDSGAPN